MAWIRGRNRRFALGISCSTNGAEYNGCKIGWNDCERYRQGRWEGFLEGFGAVVFAGNPQHVHQLYGPYTFLSFCSKSDASQIRHLQSLLALRLRTRLTRYLHDLYLSSNPDLRYYRASNYLDGIDQYLTADVEAWSNAMSGL